MSYVNCKSTEALKKKASKTINKQSKSKTKLNTKQNPDMKPKEKLYVCLTNFTPGFAYFKNIKA